MEFLLDLKSYLPWPIKDRNVTVAWNSMGLLDWKFHRRANMLGKHHWTVQNVS